MLNLVAPIIICFSTQKQFTTLNNIQVLLKSVFIDLCARNVVHPKTSLPARCMHARHRACNLSSPEVSPTNIFQESKKSRIVIISQARIYTKISQTALNFAWKMNK